MQRAYWQLFELGFAHSVETWLDGKLVGGLYGLAIGRMFYGESMFSSASNASKIAAAHLARLPAVQHFADRIGRIADQQHVAAGSPGGVGAPTMSPATAAPSIDRSSLKMTPSKPSSLRSISSQTGEKPAGRDRPADR